MKFNKENYFKGTYGVFEPAVRPSRVPDFVSYRSYYDEELQRYISTAKVSSEYWYTDKGVIRNSDHWGSVGNCFWKNREQDNNYIWSAGYCGWDSFYPIRDYRIVGKRRITPENFNGEPLLKAGMYLAIAFYREEVCFVNRMSKNECQPLLYHPNHHSQFVRIVDFGDNKLKFE